MNDFKNFTLGQFTATFVPFGLAMVAAMMGAESALSLNDQRMITSVWAAQGLLIPALFLYYAPYRAQVHRNLWVLFWTFAFLAYLVHFYYAVFVHYHGIADAWKQQGPKIAGSNFLDTAWWAFDVLLAWTVKGDVKWVRIERLLFSIYLPLTFFVASVVIFKGFVNVIGYSMTAAVVLGLAIRIVHWWKVKHGGTVSVQHA